MTAKVSRGSKRYSFPALFEPANFSEGVVSAIKDFGMQPKRTSFQSPWQNGTAERWIESCRRDAFDHLIAINERHLKRPLNEYIGGGSVSCRLVVTHSALSSRLFAVAVSPIPNGKSLQNCYWFL
jgi:hypothetical protein